MLTFQPGETTEGLKQTRESDSEGLYRNGEMNTTVGETENRDAEDPMAPESVVSSQPILVSASEVLPLENEEEKDLKSTGKRFSHLWLIFGVLFITIAVASYFSITLAAENAKLKTDRDQAASESARQIAEAKLTAAQEAKTDVAEAIKETEKKLANAEIKLLEAEMSLKYQKEAEADRRREEADAAQEAREKAERAVKENEKKLANAESQFFSEHENYMRQEAARQKQEAERRQEEAKEALEKSERRIELSQRKYQNIFKNDAGDKVKLGTDEAMNAQEWAEAAEDYPLDIGAGVEELVEGLKLNGTFNFYCGKYIGGSNEYFDGNCGPSCGPNCESCQRFQKWFEAVDPDLGLTPPRHEARVLQPSPPCPHP